MNTIKVAITIPQDLVMVIDMLSKQNGLSRSKYITGILRENILKENERILKEQYDSVFSDKDILKEQRDMSHWFEGTDLAEGQEW
ncbi:MAG: hypothetical protein KKD44_14280 [Proteobacteria bacterium]|nr:hypothetical protein [Pseudomonadota bacterium]